MNGRTRFTDTYTLALILTLATTLVFGNPTDTVIHWFARVAGSILAAHLAVSWWRNRHRDARQRHRN